MKLNQITFWDIIGVAFGILLMVLGKLFNNHTVSMGIESDLEFWIVMGCGYFIMLLGTFTILYSALHAELHDHFHGPFSNRNQR